MKQVKMLVWMCVGATLAAWLLDVKDESLAVINASVLLTLLLELKQVTGNADYPFAKLRVVSCCLLAFLNFLLNGHIVRTAPGHIGVMTAILTGMVLVLGLEQASKNRPEFGDSLRSRKGLSPERKRGDSNGGQ